MALRDDGNGRFTWPPNRVERARDGVMEQTIEIVRRRVEKRVFGNRPSSARAMPRSCFNCRASTTPNG